MVRVVTSSFGTRIDRRAESMAYSNIFADFLYSFIQLVSFFDIFYKLYIFIMPNNIFFYRDLYILVGSTHLQVSNTEIHSRDLRTLSYDKMMSLKISSLKFKVPRR